MCRFLTRGAAWAAALALALLVALLATLPAAIAAPTWKPVVDFGVGSYAPVVATNSRGDAAVAYRTDSGLLVRTRKAGGSWSAPITVFSGGTYSPDIGIDARGRATVAASVEFGDGDRAVVVRSQSSTGWGAPKELSSRTANHHSLRLAVAATGAAVIAYGNTEDLLATSGAAAADDRARAAYRAAGGQRWSAPKVLSRVDGYTTVDAVIDDRGRATVAWRRTTETSAVLEARTSNSTGAFKPVVTVASGGGMPWAWRIAANAAGTVSVAWQWEPTAPAGVDYVMTRTRQPGRSFGAAKRLTSATTIYQVDTAVAANGIVTTAWNRRETTPATESVEARQRGRNQVWSATRKVASGSAPLYNVRLEPAAGNAAALVWVRDDGDVRRVASRVLSAAGSLSTPRNVMTSGFLAFATASSRAGDVLVGGLSPEGRVWARVLDTAGPVAKLRQPSARFTSSRKVTGAWTAADAWSTVSSYTVLRRAAKAHGGFGGTSKWTTTRSKRKSFTGIPGTTYCLTVRAKDSVGNSGAASAGRCVAVPLDDRGLSASAGWTKARSKGSYLGTVRTTSATGRSLSVKVRTKRLALLVTRCPSCGVVDVFLGNTKLKRISLAGKAGKRVLLPVKAFGSMRSGTVRIVVVSSGKRVTIDGLGTSHK